MTLASWPTERNETVNNRSLILGVPPNYGLNTGVVCRLYLTFLWVSYHVAFPQNTSPLPAILSLQHTELAITKLLC